MRTGEFGIYKGNEYEIGYLEDDNVILYSDKPLNEFEESRQGLYIKIVELCELEEAYDIKPRGQYKGKKVTIDDEKGDEILIGTGDYEFARENKFFENDFLEHVKWVHKNELEKMWEEKETIEDN